MSQDDTDTQRMLAALYDEIDTLRATLAASEAQRQSASSSFDLGGAEAQDLIRACRRVYYRNPIGRNAVEGLRLFVGAGSAVVRSLDEDPATQAVLTEFHDRNNMNQRLDEYIRRALRDGTGMLKLFRHGGRHEDRTIPDGFMTARFLDVLRIRPDFESAAMGGCGVVTDPDDIESVKGYTYDPSDKMVGSLWIDAEFVYALKLFADSDMLFGRPLIEPVLKRIRQYDQWVEQRIIANRLRTSMYMKRRVKANSIAGITGGDPMSERVGRTDRMKLPPAGTVLTSNDLVDYEFMTPNLQAQDVTEDGRRILIDIAAGIGMPMPLLTGDVSETTYAGLVVAESPFVKRAEDIRATASVQIRKVYEAVLEEAVAAGRPSSESYRTTMTAEARAELEMRESEIRDAHGDDRRTARARAEVARIISSPNSYERVAVDRNMSVEVQWPEIVMRDLEKTSKAMALIDSMRLASRSTLAGMIGINFSEEQKRMAAEQAATNREFDEQDREAIEIGPPDPQEPDSAGFQDQSGEDGEDG